jgi:hypothetical protein
MRLLNTLAIIFLVIISGGGILASLYLFYQNQQMEIRYENKIQQLTTEKTDTISNQRQQKNEIADIFDSQAGLNDDLTDQQRRLSGSATNYINLIDGSIGFIQEKPQFISDLKEEKLLELKNSLVQEISFLEKLAQENAELKKKNSDKIQQIYIDAKEERNNTANDREGIRGE